jgi:hypothetical protein
LEKRCPFLKEQILSSLAQATVLEPFMLTNRSTQTQHTHTQKDRERERGEGKNSLIEKKLLHTASTSTSDFAGAS